MVKIASGTTQDQKLRLKGFGLPDGPSGDRGDMYVRVGVRVPSELTEEQQKLISSLAEAGL